MSRVQVRDAAPLSFDELCLGWRAASLAERAEWLSCCPEHERNCTRDNDPERTAALKNAFMRSLRFGRNDLCSRRLATDSISESNLDLLLRREPPRNSSPPDSIVHWLHAANAVDLEAAEPVHVFPFKNSPPWHLIEYLWPLIDKEITTLESHRASLESGSRDAPSFPKGFATHWTTLYVDAISPLILRALVQEEHIAAEFEAPSPETLNEYPSSPTPSSHIIAGQQLKHQYPVLFRRMIERLSSQTTFLVDFLTRMYSDWGMITTSFGVPKTTHVHSIVSSGSDPHDRGATVLLVNFMGTDRKVHIIVYKPRSLGPEKRFYYFLSSLKTININIDVYVPQIADMSKYGWMEFVPHKSCAPAEISVYYRNLGTMSAVLYLLHTTDIHAENLISHSASPVFFDLETILHPTEDMLSERGQHRSQSIVKARSILGIGLFPEYVRSHDIHAPLLISGIVPSRGVFRDLSLVRDASTSRFRFEYHNSNVETSGNIPSQDSAMAFGHHATDFWMSFRRCLEACASNIDVVTQIALRAFESLHIRVLVRQTRYYQLLLEGAFHPSRGSDAALQEIWLNRLYEATVSLPEVAKLIPAEFSAIARGDIPKFMMLSGERGVREVGLQAELMETVRSPLENVVSHIGALSLPAIEQQDTIFRQILSAWEVTEGIGGRIAKGRNYKQAAERRTQCAETACAALLQAKLIGDEITKHSLCLSGCKSWASVTSEDEHHWMCAPAGPYLYDGISGIIYFLMYLGAKSGLPKYEEVARAAYQTVRIEMLARSNDDIPLGAFTGIAGYLLLLCHIRAVWPDEKPAAESEINLYVDIIEDNCDRIVEVDLLSGLAGIAVCMLRAARCGIFPERTLSIANRCGDTLVLMLKERNASKGPRKIGNSDEFLLGGFAHGSAGIGWCLREIANETGRRVFSDLAADLTAYDDTLFSRELGNWLDLRVYPERRPCFAAWCHGAGGVALSRTTDVSEWSNQESAIELTFAEIGRRSDCLCHGDLGNIVVLQDLEKFGLLKASQVQRLQYFESIISQRVGVGEFRTGVAGCALNWGLMTGLSGIGYGLLRINDRNLPNILSLDGPKC